MNGKTILTLSLLALSVTSCATQGRNTTYRKAGHPFATDIGCIRAERFGKYDRLCDNPLLGYKGFAAF